MFAGCEAWYRNVLNSRKGEFGVVTKEKDLWMFLKLCEWSVGGLITILQQFCEF